MRRRKFLGALAGGGGLIVAGLPPSVLAQPSGALPPSALDQNALEVVAAFVPAVLGESALPPTPEARKQAIVACAYGVGVSVTAMPERTQKELAGLFGYLSQSGPQSIQASFPKKWSEMPPQAMQAVLQGMRTDEKPQGRSIYYAMHGMITGVWYSSAQTWPSINYPGPPKI